MAKCSNCRKRPVEEEGDVCGLCVDVLITESN